MKVVSLIIAFVVSFQFGFGQGSIQGITISPANPTTIDTIYIYADLSFPSGDCPLDFKDHQLSGTDIQATSHHCLGMLTVICNTTDTFKINPLPASNYDFILTLTSGGGPVPCTPGIAVDDTDTLSFTVTDVVGIDELMPGIYNIPLAPGETTISFAPYGDKVVEAELYSFSGAKTSVVNLEDKKLDISKLSPGHYHLKVVFSDCYKMFQFTIE